MNYCFLIFKAEKNYLTMDQCIFQLEFLNDYIFQQFIKIFQLEKIGFYENLIDATGSAFELFHFFYFVRELHRQIVCDNPLTSRILNFLITIEQVLFDHRKCLVELRNFCKKLLERRKLTDFFSIGQWS